MRDMVSTTPLAEYVDMIYTRLLLEMPKHTEVTSWNVELHPPSSSTDGAGVVMLRADSFTYAARMNAVEQGAVVGLEELDTVVDYHIRQFVRGFVDEES